MAAYNPLSWKGQFACALPNRLCWRPIRARRDRSLPESDFMRIAMIGTGYVGLVSGACLSEFGHDVVCIDKDAAKVETLRAGGIPIFEPGLEEAVAANMKAGRLAFETDLARAVKDADAVF